MVHEYDSEERDHDVLLGYYSHDFLATTLLMCSGVNALREGFYATSYLNAEGIIYEKMQVLVVDKDLPAYILRLHFHDYLVCGCDVSVLIVGSGTSSSRCNLILHLVDLGFGKTNALIVAPNANSMPL